MRLPLMPDYDSQGIQEVGEKAPQSDSLSALFLNKTRILRTKLEVLVLEIHERFQIRDRNVDRIDGNRSLVEHIIEKLMRNANYRLREHKDKTSFYGAWFDLTAELRKQDVECWRDVVMVMRDFLYTWEAHEHAQSRSHFLNHA